jgi:hypothetical protein
MFHVNAAERRIPALLKMMDEQQAEAEEQHHQTIEEPALPRLANHAAERVRQCRRDENNRQHFEKICQRNGILVRMSSIGVKESATIRAEILDDF